MALGASIYKAHINLSNFNLHHYDDFSLTLAKHPSENESRMMFRLICYLYFAQEGLEFTKGLCETKEPELWKKGLSGEILHWLELGMPDEKKIRQALGKSELVSIFTYHDETAKNWHEKSQKIFNSHDKLKGHHLRVFENGPLDKLVEKSMKLSCIVEDDHLYLGNDHERIGVQVLSGPPELW
ncbi:MAG: YaeQ family protein [Bacteriovoracaceae bacterium]